MSSTRLSTASRSLLQPRVKSQAWQTCFPWLWLLSKLRGNRVTQEWILTSVPSDDGVVGKINSCPIQWIWFHILAIVFVAVQFITVATVHTSHVPVGWQEKVIKSLWQIHKATALEQEKGQTSYSHAASFALVWPDSQKNGCSLTSAPALCIVPSSRFMTPSLYWISVLWG